MNQHYAHILIFLIMGAVFPVVSLCLSALLRPKSNDPQQQLPYECGMPPVGTPYVPMKIGFYLFALLFVLFDLETLFLFPWAVVFREFGWIGLLDMGLFMAVLALGLFYVWKRGALRWAF